MTPTFLHYLAEAFSMLCYVLGFVVILAITLMTLFCACGFMEWHIEVDDEEDKNKDKLDAFDRGDEGERK